MRSVGIARRGARNLLIHAGILDGEPERGESVELEMAGDDCFTFADRDGLIEPCADLGDAVAAGQVLARVWPVDRTGTAPYELRARLDGLLAGRHFPGLVKAGDCVGVVARRV